MCCIFLFLAWRGMERHFEDRQAGIYEKIKFTGMCNDSMNTISCLMFGVQEIRSCSVVYSEQAGRQAEAFGSI